MDKKIILLCKTTMFCQYAIKILESYYSQQDILCIPSDGKESLEPLLQDYNYEYLISFLSPWIIKAALLEKATKAAINFHPGSPDYPGSGCYNFAIYEKSPIYGVTCHHMNPQVDTGDIIYTSYFDMAPKETVETIKLKSMNHLLYLFEKTINNIYTKDSLPKSDETWRKKPYTMKQFNAMRCVDPKHMSHEEIQLRIRAINYHPDHEGVYVQVGNERLVHKFTSKLPIV